MSPSDRIMIEKLPGPLGAEVVGIDAKGDLPPELFARIVEALREHRLLLFRDVAPGNEALLRFARRFGEVVRFYEEGTEPGFPEILRVSNIEEAGRPIGVTANMEIPWHTDYGNHPRPAKESFLEAIEVPRSVAGATSFIDMYAAWEGLPADLRARLQGREALHRPKGEYDLDDATSAATQSQRNAIQTAHPVAVRHPDTGRAALYVSPVETTEIVGASEGESRELFERVWTHVIRPEHVYRHTWSPRELVVFDAIGTMHHREGFPASERRFMKQVSTRCDSAPRAA
jgi:alpha-ketoglutarate-dependent taurine dioxygenase